MNNTLAYSPFYLPHFVRKSKACNNNTFYLMSFVRILTSEGEEGQRHFGQLISMSCYKTI